MKLIYLEVESNKRLRLFVSILEVTFVTDSPIGQEIIIQPIKTHVSCDDSYLTADWEIVGKVVALTF